MNLRVMRDELLPPRHPPRRHLISIKDLEYHGYHSGMKMIDQLIAELSPDLTYADMIFFTEEQVATMKTGAVNSAQDRIVEITDKAKAKAAG